MSPSAHDLALAIAPYPETALACTVALAPEPVAREAWTAWLDRLGPKGIMAVSHASGRVLPLVATRLDPLGIQHPDVERVRGTHRKLLTQSLMFQHRIAPPLRRLVDRGVEVALVGALGRARTVYPPGTRFVDRAEIGVRPDQLADALAILADLGCETRFSVVAEPPVSDHHRLTLPDGLELLVRSHLTLASLGHGGDRWERTRALSPSAIDGLALRQLAPEDALLQIAADAMTTDEERFADWLVDLGITITRVGIDWSLLVAEAERYDLQLTLATALDVLSAIGVALPPTVLPALARHSDLEAAALGARLSLHPPRDALWRTYRHAVAPRANPLAAAAGFVRFAALRLGGPRRIARNIPRIAKRFIRS